MMIREFSVDTWAYIVDDITKATNPSRLSFITLITPKPD